MRSISKTRDVSVSKLIDLSGSDMRNPREELGDSEGYQGSKEFSEPDNFFVASEKSYW